MNIESVNYMRDIGDVSTKAIVMEKRSKNKLMNSTDQHPTNNVILGGLSVVIRIIWGRIYADVILPEEFGIIWGEEKVGGCAGCRKKAPLITGSHS